MELFSEILTEVEGGSYDKGKKSDTERHKVGSHWSRSEELT